MHISFIIIQTQDTVSMKPPDILLNDKASMDDNVDKSTIFSTMSQSPTTQSNSPKILNTTMNNLDPISDNVKQRILEPDDTSLKQSRLFHVSQTTDDYAITVRDPNKSIGIDIDDGRNDNDIDSIGMTSYSPGIAEYSPDVIDVIDYSPPPPDGKARQISFSCLDEPFSNNIQSLIMELDTDMLMSDTNDLPADLERWIS